MRFQVITLENETYQIVDTEYKTYNTREMAVNIFFGNKYRADEVCNYLNNEWNAFVKNAY